VFGNITPFSLPLVPEYVCHIDWTDGKCFSTFPYGTCLLSGLTLSVQCAFVGWSCASARTIPELITTICAIVTLIHTYSAFERQYPRCSQWNLNHCYSGVYTIPNYENWLHLPQYIQHYTSRTILEGLTLGLSRTGLLQLWLCWVAVITCDTGSVAQVSFEYELYVHIVWSLLKTRTRQASATKVTWPTKHLSIKTDLLMQYIPHWTYVRIR
jgi:hypothetical protein